MYDFLYFLIFAGISAAVLALAYILFALALYAAYKADGGRRGLISYLKENN